MSIVIQCPFCDGRGCHRCAEARALMTPARVRDLVTHLLSGKYPVLELAPVERRGRMCWLALFPDPEEWDAANPQSALRNPQSQACPDDGHQWTPTDEDALLLRCTRPGCRVTRRFSVDATGDTFYLGRYGRWHQVIPVDPQFKNLERLFNPNANHKKNSIPARHAGPAPRRRKTRTIAPAAAETRPPADPQQQNDLDLPGVPGA